MIGKGAVTALGQKQRHLKGKNELLFRILYVHKSSAKEVKTHPYKNYFPTTISIFRKTKIPEVDRMRLLY